MAKKTFNQKLRETKDLPKIVDLTEQPEAMKRYKSDNMLVASPMQYHSVMATVPFGKLITVDRIRQHLAQEANVGVTCPLTAGIFTNVVAHASVERADESIPWWRTLKTKGELNPKYPGGIEEQQRLLEAEGHIIQQKGKRYVVASFEDALISLPS